jgi:hypothetical protein
MSFFIFFVAAAEWQKKDEFESSVELKGLRGCEVEFQSRTFESWREYKRFVMNKDARKKR